MLSKKLKGLLLVLLTGSIGLPLSSCAYQDNIDSSSTSSESSDSMDDSSMEDTSSGEDTSSISSSDGIDYQALFPGSIQYATYDGVISYTNKTTYIQIDGYVASSTSSKAGIVDIPNTISNLPVTTIKDEAFKYATLDKTVIRTIIIPDSITTIGIKSFYGLYDVTTIQINPTSNLVSIGRGAFSFCLSLTDIYIPSGVKSIPDTCFYHCESLGETTKEYYYYDTTSSSVKHTTYTSGTDYTAGITYASTPTVCMFGMNSFGYCYGLTTFTCPSSLRIIKDRTFIACENLTTVVLNNGLVKIDREVFMYCSALESVNLNNESSEGAGDATIEIVGVDCFSTCNTTNEYGYTIYTPVLSLYKAHLWKNVFPLIT